MARAGSCGNSVRLVDLFVQSIRPVQSCASVLCCPVFRLCGQGERSDRISLLIGARHIASDELRGREAVLCSEIADVGVLYGRKLLKGTIHFDGCGEGRLQSRGFVEIVGGILEKILDRVHLLARVL